MTRIFISYRRNDSLKETGRIYDHLVEAFGKDNIFRDFDSIPTGKDFRDAIIKASNQCDVMLVIIGRKWLDIKDDDGKRRLENPDDLVRKEVEAGLQRDNCLVVPVLVDEARPPSADTLPFELRKLASNQATNVRDDPDFSRDMEKLLKQLQREIASSARTSSNDQHLKYLEDLDDFLSDYLSQKTIPSLHDEALRPKPLELRGVPSPYREDVLFSSGGKERTRTLESAFLHFEERLILLGEPGSGKTHNLVTFARNAVKARINDTSKPLPIFATVASWKCQDELSLIKWLSTQNNVPENLEDVLAHGKALLILDGLDELGKTCKSDSKPEDRDPRVEFMQLLPSNNAVVVSCRTDDYAQIDDKVSLNGTLTLMPLDRRQIEKYLEDYPELFEAVKADWPLRELAKNPLLLSILSSIFDHLSEGERKNFRSMQEAPWELREKIFESYLLKRDEHERKKRTVRLPLEYEDFIAQIKQVATRNCLYNQYDDINFQAFIVPLTPEQMTALTQQAKALHVVIKEGEKTRFIHGLLQDYLALGEIIVRLGARTHHGRRLQTLERMSSYHPRAKSALDYWKLQYPDA